MAPLTPFLGAIGGWWVVWAQDTLKLSQNVADWENPLRGGVGGRTPRSVVWCFRTSRKEAKKETGHV